MEPENMPKMAVCPNTKRAGVFSVVTAGLRICDFVTSCAVFQTNFTCATAVRQTLNSQQANIVIFTSEYFRTFQFKASARLPSIGLT